MPGQRSAGQILIGTWCDEDFVAEIDKVRQSTRSQFCRDALLEKLKNMGVDTKGLLTRPPHPAGKRGTSYSINTRVTRPHSMNEKSNSAGTSELINKAPRALRTALREDRARRPSPGVAGTSGNKPAPKRGIGRRLASPPPAPDPARE
jgi:hypothetical protein